MEYRKFTAEGIFNGYELMSGETVLITDTLGVVVDIVDKVDAGGDLEEYSGILSPGFINCHCHLELSHLRGLIPEHTGLVDFILKVVNERHFEEAAILQAIEQAEQEMWQNGIVGVGDICNNSMTIAQKSKDRLRYHNFIEVSGFPPSIANERFNKAKILLDSFHSTFETKDATLTPHSPYSVSPELFTLINDLRNNRLLSIHNQETIEEDRFFVNGGGDFQRLYREMKIDISFFHPGGNSSLPTWLPYFNNHQSLILVHNVTTTVDDIRVMQSSTSHLSTETFLCLCPNANLYISGVLPDVNLFIQENCKLVVGTDSLASNHQLSILEEIKTLQKYFPGLELTTLLQWATINGARALQMDEVFGSFEKGKRPGVVLIEGCEGKHLSANVRVKRVV